MLWRLSLRKKSEKIAKCQLLPVYSTPKMFENAQFMVVEDVKGLGKFKNLIGKMARRSFCECTSLLVSSYLKCFLVKTDRQPFAGITSYI